MPTSVTRLLLLGGTSEASALARALSDQGVDAIFSYAGVTKRPIAQPLPTRVGGFGGAAGLAQFLTNEGITHVVDATHPFAAQMSTNAVAACTQTGVALAALERSPWVLDPGWTRVADMDGAVAALPDRDARVFLAIGKKQTGAFAAKPDNFYLLRMIDAPATQPTLPNHALVTGRGPFTVDGDTALIRQHAITHLVAKNGGSDSARAKLDAARALDIDVIMIDRPKVPQRHICTDVASVLRWLGHTDLGV